ncbi:hypothetical protein AVEN_229214-1 [Araneus ventricosus]|uniref:DUF4817 domain-containing protein n=1 Tax=Araneus ventricosus TaxID=182803 RepID=A0A4Y2SAA4_ARAVE|nr:hypothetical protein AVEN_229214-1 [Araneus ventricosus]
MGAMYSIRDYCDMYLMYGQCNGNALRTAREYARRYPSRRPPDCNVIRRLDDRLRNTGSVLPTANLHDTERPRSGLKVAQADAILQRVEETPEVSTRALAREMTSGTVHRILRSERLHPFRYTTVQGLKPDDFQKGMAFCEWLLQQQNTDNGFIAHILWTDESCFTRDGVFNHHNSHMWSQLSGQSYLVFLNEVLTEFLDDIPLATIQGLWFQHNGAPAHFCVPVRGWLDMEYPGRWIGRGGPVLWPPRSPDLTPLDFFLWGHLKELVYRDIVTTQMDLVARLHAACTSVDPAMLQRVMTAIPRRAQACPRHAWRTL